MARGEIWAIDIPAPKGKPGREQIGMRPGIVVQADTADPRLPTTIVIPATSKKEAQRFPYTIMVEPSAQNGLDKPSGNLTKRFLPGSCSRRRGVSSKTIPVRLILLDVNEIRTGVFFFAADIR